jgi:serine protease Do
MKNNFFAKLKKNTSLMISIVLISGMIFGFLGGLLSVYYIVQKDGIKDSTISSLVQKNENVKLTESSAVIDSAKKVSPAVVSISATTNVSDIFGSISQQKSAGSGFIITSDGLVLTNKHVVSSTTAEYTVITSDGKTYKGSVMARDPLNDLAIVKIEARNLKTVDLGDSNDLQIGQLVIAIGNALGEFQNTVTRGVLSALDRSLTASDSSSQTGSEELFGLLQTDAAINPGNSGGPLVNSIGQVIGINTAVASSAENLGFAIPVNAAKTAIESYKKSGAIVRPMIGIRYVTLTKEIADQNDIPVSDGVIIYSQDPGLQAIVLNGPADKVGLKQGDIITQIDNQKLDANNSLKKILLQHKAGDTIKIKYLRDNKERNVSLKLGEMK